MCGIDGDSSTSASEGSEAINLDAAAGGGGGPVIPQWGYVSVKEAARAMERAYGPSPAYAPRAPVNHSHSHSHGHSQGQGQGVEGASPAHSRRFHGSSPAPLPPRQWGPGSSPAAPSFGVPLPPHHHHHQQCHQQQCQQPQQQQAAESYGAGSAFVYRPLSPARAAAHAAGVSPAPSPAPSFDAYDAPLGVSMGCAEGPCEPLGGAHGRPAATTVASVPEEADVFALMAQGRVDEGSFKRLLRDHARRVDAALFRPDPVPAPAAATAYGPAADGSGAAALGYGPRGAKARSGSVGFFDGPGPGSAAAAAAATPAGADFFEVLAAQSRGSMLGGGGGGRLRGLSASMHGTDRSPTKVTRAILLWPLSIHLYEC
jgi:hypothetical protein